MAYRLVPPSEDIEQMICNLERGPFIYTPLLPHYETTRALKTHIRANIHDYTEHFLLRHGYWPSIEDPLREVHRLEDRDRRDRYMPRLINVSGAQGTWIVPDSGFHLCLAASMYNLYYLSPSAIGKGRNSNALFLSGPLTHRQLSALHEGYFIASLRKIGMPGYDFGHGMIDGGESIFISLLPAVEYSDFAADFSSFTDMNAGPQRTRHQGEASGLNTHKADQREGAQTRKPIARDRSPHQEQDDDENEDDYEIENQPHRPQRRNPRRPVQELNDEGDFGPRSIARRAHDTGDELDDEEDLQSNRKATRVRRSTQGGGSRRAHDTDNELDSEDNLQPTRNVTRAGGARRPHDSDTELDRDGRLRPTRVSSTRRATAGDGGAGRSTQPQAPKDAGRSTLKGAIRDNGYKGVVDSEEEEPPAYEDVGQKEGRGVGKGKYRSGRTLGFGRTGL